MALAEEGRTHTQVCRAFRDGVLEVARHSGTDHGGSGMIRPQSFGHLSQTGERWPRLLSQWRNAHDAGQRERLGRSDQVGQTGNVRRRGTAPARLRGLVELDLQAHLERPDPANCGCVQR